MSYVLFFASLLLVMFLPWLVTSSDQPCAPARTYRNSFLLGLGLISAAWFVSWITGVTRASTLLLVLAGAALGAVITTAIDTGLVYDVDPRWTDRWEQFVAGRGDSARPTIAWRIGVGIGALVGLVTTLPLWLAIGALIWIEDPGPVLALRASVGTAAPSRRRLTFRTVRYRPTGVNTVGAPPPGDGRPLGVGTLLRSTGLEQLPTLVNVLARAVGADRPRRPTRRRPAIAGDLSSLGRPAKRRRPGLTVTAVASVALVAAVAIVVANRPTSTSAPTSAAKPSGLAAPMVVPQVFDPDKDAVLPRNRVVAFYGVPGAAATGPAYTLDGAMLDRLRAQGAEYEQLDPEHPVALGIDLVASIPDQDPGPAGTYSHRLDAAVLDRYLDFCRTNHLLLFLDLSFGWSDPQEELKYFLPYLALPFVHLAVDPEWMFPRHNGVPGINLSNVRAADINPLITTMAELPMKYHIPRKIVILHQFRPTGDGLNNPYNPGAAEIADKSNVVKDPRVDVVWHVDSVGGWVGDIAAKTQQYGSWVRHDMNRFGNFQYGGFKIFYQLESKNRLMTPKEVMALKPPPMVVTYGN